MGRAACSVGPLVCWCAGAHFASLVPSVGDRSLAPRRCSRTELTVLTARELSAASVQFVIVCFLYTVGNVSFSPKFIFPGVIGFLEEYRACHVSVCKKKKLSRSVYLCLFAIEEGTAVHHTQI